MMARKPKYNKEILVKVIADYFYAHRNEKLFDYSFETIYEDIRYYASKSLLYKKVEFPGYEHMRKILINELKSKDRFQQGEKLTTAVASRIMELYFSHSYYIEKTISEQYSLSVYCDPVITCVVNIPPVEAVDILAKEKSASKNKSVSWGRINIIRELCKEIKQKNPDVILAVIPQYNRMIYLNEKGRIDKHVENINPLFDTLIMFVRDCPEGRQFIEENKFPVFP